MGELRQAPGPYTREVFYYETDSMRIVHHSNYFRYMEEARLAYLEALGMSYDQMEADGIIIPVVSAQAEYKNSLVFGDRFSVDMVLTEYNGIRFGCEYEIRKLGTDVIAATGKTTHCFLNREMQLFRFPKLFPEYDRCFREMLRK